MKSKFTSIENQFLNTFFSGLYISANEFIDIGAQVGLKMGMNTRELLIKELLNKSDKEGNLGEVVELLNSLVQSRIDKYNSLSRDYPASATMLASLAQKANSTRTLLASQQRGNPYE